MKKDWVLYAMIAPVILYFLIFRAWPILNLRLAFFDFKSRSAWEYVGLKYFKMMFGSPQIWNILRNTIIISLMKYALLTPLVVIFALMLNEMRNKFLRKYTQVVSYLPHFFSWVVITGIWMSFLNTQNGAVNSILAAAGKTPVDFLTEKGWIRWILVFSEAWRSLGWDSIIYVVALLNIDVTLYEAAQIDGASRFQMLLSITLPALVAPITTVCILNLGFFMSAGFDQVFNFSNASVNSAIDILDTYIYRIGFENGQYSLASAASLFKGIIGAGLICATHIISKKLTGEGVWSDENQ
jgi:putative aldouronate transport system permease protein